MRVAEAIVDVVASVDPTGLSFGQPAVTDQVTEDLAETLAPPGRQLLLDDAPATAVRAGERLDLDRQLPRRFDCWGRRVVDEDLVVRCQFFGWDVAAVER